MPHKRNRAKTQIYSEVTPNVHTRLLSIKQTERLPLYRIIEICILFALKSPNFMVFLRDVVTPKVDTMDL